ncbi:MAG: response regulator [Thermoplasmatota archaeon]
MKKKLLVVDDNQDVCITIKYIFEANDEYEVFTVESGEECLDFLKTHIPNAIILDIMLPGIDGLETYERIKENKDWSKIPVLFLTARDDNFIEGAGRFLGDDFIEKPFDTSDLKFRIERAIEDTK